jgi:membrane-bound lytic murein transglycosylase B
MFSSSHATPGVSYAAALKNHKQPQPCQVAEPAPAGVEQTRVPPPAQQCLQQGTNQSAQATNVNSASLNNMFRDASVVQQIMTGLNEAVSEEKKIVAITKIVLTLMNNNGC